MLSNNILVLYINNYFVMSIINPSLLSCQQHPGIQVVSSSQLRGGLSIELDGFPVPYTLVFVVEVQHRSQSEPALFSVFSTFLMMSMNLKRFGWRWASAELRRWWKPSGLLLVLGPMGFDDDSRAAQGIGHRHQPSWLPYNRWTR